MRRGTKIRFHGNNYSSYKELINHPFREFRKLRKRLHQKVPTVIRTKGRKYMYLSNVLLRSHVIIRCFVENKIVEFFALKLLERPRQKFVSKGGQRFTGLFTFFMGFRRGLGSLGYVCLLVVFHASARPSRLFNWIDLYPAVTHLLLRTNLMQIVVFCSATRTHIDHFFPIVVFRL